MSKKSYMARSSILFSSNHSKSAPLQSQLQNQAATQKMILAVAAALLRILDIAYIDQKN